MLVPLNQIIQSQYTAGSQFSERLTGKNYQGYYCILGKTRFFSGKTINSGSIELVQTVTSSLAQNNSVVQTSNAQTNTVRYFIKKKNVVPILIQEVNQLVFQTFQNNPLYQTISINSLDIYEGSPKLAAVEVIMPGITLFLFS